MCRETDRKPFRFNDFLFERKYMKNLDRLARNGKVKEYRYYMDYFVRTKFTYYSENESGWI